MDLFSSIQKVAEGTPFQKRGGLGACDDLSHDIARKVLASGEDRQKPLMLSYTQL